MNVWEKKWKELEKLLADRKSQLDNSIASGMATPRELDKLKAWRTQVASIQELMKY